MSAPTVADLELWVAEADPALRGAFVHRMWRRSDDAWVILARFHEGNDPEQRAVARVALELAVESEFARANAVPPEVVEADDKQQKKSASRDQHPFLVLLRKRLGGARIEGLRQVPGERIVELDCRQLGPPDPVDPDRPRDVRLVVELVGRRGNLILCALPEPGPVCLGSLHAGRAARPFTAGERYQAPPPRPPRPGPPPVPALVADVTPDKKTLALGRAVVARQREKSEAAGSESRQRIMRKAAAKGVERLEGALKKLEAQLAETARAGEFERQGDLLKANLGEIKKGASEVTLTDYTVDPPQAVILTLDPKLTPHEAMKKLYKRAKKLRAGESSVSLRLGETDAKLEDARALLAETEAVDPEDEAGLERLEARLRKQGLLPKETIHKPRQQLNQGPRSYRSLEGHEILVGRSDEENDRLTMRVARGKDLFFHVRGCPGSHVILRVDPQRPPNHDSILDAATLAVHYSKARNRGAVDVSYTPRKWVKKPKGAKPGLVQISNEKTVRAGHDQERLRRVLDSLRRPGDEEDA